MKISGIICEYNPLHLGHIRHINYTKQKSSTVICLMSGNFTQRGTPACMDKYARARHAILGGADLVLELPAVFATSSAENFAFGGVKMLSALGCDYLSFGSECGDVTLLKECAEIMLNPPLKVTSALKTALHNGRSYPLALSTALVEFDSRFDILTKPNNTLAIEYIKQLIAQNSPMQPITVERQDNYNSEQLIGEYASSSAIREAIDKGENLDLTQYIPSYVNCDISKSIIGEYKKFVHAYVNTLSANYLQQIEGVMEGLENRIVANAHLSTYDEMLFAIKTRRYTLAKLQRILLSAVLGVTKETMCIAKEVNPYATILAINKDRLDLLTYMAQMKINLPQTLTKKQKYIHDFDVKASNIYYALTNQKGNKDYSALQKI